MKNRADRQIKSEITRLKKERKTIKEYSIFGNNNWECIDEQVEFLQKYLDSKVYDYDFDEILEDLEAEVSESEYMEHPKKLAIDFIKGY